MPVPIIGQKRQEQAEVDPVHLNVCVDSGNVLFTITILGGYGMAKAHLAPEAAPAVIQSIALAIEALRPGTLIPGVEAWLTALKAERDKAREVINTLKMA